MSGMVHPGFRLVRLYLVKAHLIFLVDQLVFLLTVIVWQLEQVEMIIQVELMQALQELLNGTGIHGFN